jgi:hypothetical protein
MGLTLNRNGTQDDLVLGISFPALPPVHWKEAKVTLVNCTIIRMDVDLDFKRVCADSISSVSCKEHSELKTQIEKKLKYETAPLEGFYHFSIHLIPYGGNIEIFAKDFEVDYKQDDFMSLGLGAPS